MSEEPAQPIARPSMPARLLAAIPLLVLFCELAYMLRMWPKLNHVFREMVFYRLPWTTEVAIALSNTLMDFWYLFAPLMFVVSWIFFAWGCKSLQRMLWFAWAVALLDLLVLGFGIVAFVEAWIDIFEGFGK